MAKKKYVNFATPAFPVAYCYLDKPDTGNKYSDDKYKVTLVIDKDDPFIEKFKEMLTQCVNENQVTVGKNFHSPLQNGDERTDKDDNPIEEFQGKFLIKMHTNDAPELVVQNPAGGNMPLPERVKIYSGDVVRAAGSMTVYGEDEGITCYLDKVKLIEKRNMGGQQSADEAFGDDDASYVPPSASLEDDSDPAPASDAPAQTGGKINW